MPKRYRKKRKGAPYKKKRMRSKLRVPRNIINLGGGRVPMRAYCKHRYSRQIRLADPYRLNPVTGEGQTGNGPCTLIVSCNNMNGVLNQFGNNAAGDSMPAFLSSASDIAIPATSVTWDSQTIPNLLTTMRRLYTEYTVVGSKMRFNYTPTATNRPEGTSRPALMFILLKTPAASVFGGGSLSTGFGTYPVPNNLPSSAQNQPGSQERDWTRINNFKGTGVTMGAKFSTRKAFGKAKGNVVGESDLTGNPNGNFFETLNTSSPQEQMFWQLMILPAISDGTQLTELPPGIINIDIEYETVWTERQIIPTTIANP